MRKGKSVEGLKVIGQSDGSDLGKVRDLVFDYETSRVLGLVLSERELFGLVKAQVVPWSYVRDIGPDSIMVENSESVIRANDDPVIDAEMRRENGLAGCEIHTTDGQNLGSFSDIYFEEDGTIVGYEVSGGIFSDMATGRRFMPVPSSFVVGPDVAVVPPQVAQQMEDQKQSEPGGIKAVAAAASEKVAGAYDSAKSTVADTYDSAKTSVSDAYANVATASIEKQKEFVVGKVAGRDVVIPSAQTSDELNATRSVESVVVTDRSSELYGSPIGQRSEVGELAGVSPVELNTPTMAGETDVTSEGEVVDGEVLVRSGETITREHADRAESEGILHQLVAAAAQSSAASSAAAVQSSASSAFSSASESVAGQGSSLQQSAEDAAIGKPAGREVDAPDGSILVAPGMTITREIIEAARAVGRDKQVIASAGLGAASEGLSSAGDSAQHGLSVAKEQAGNLWDTIRGKASELTGAAQGKKDEMDEAAKQKRINNALGRPVTRVILDRSDTVILNTGDLITNRAVQEAEGAGVLDILLDSVYEADPEITPEMLRATAPGEASLPTQAQPSGGPITATVAPEVQAQDTPSQDIRPQSS